MPDGVEVPDGWEPRPLTPLVEARGEEGARRERERRILERRGTLREMVAEELRVAPVGDLETPRDRRGEGKSKGEWGGGAYDVSGIERVDEAIEAAGPPGARGGGAGGGGGGGGTGGGGGDELDEHALGCVAFPEFGDNSQATEVVVLSAVDVRQRMGAAVVVQAGVRRWMAKAKVKALKEAVHAATTIQAHARGASVRRAMAERTQEEPEAEPEAPLPEESPSPPPPPPVAAEKEEPPPPQPGCCAVM